MTEVSGSGGGGLALEVGVRTCRRGRKVRETDENMEEGNNGAAKKSADWIYTKSDLFFIILPVVLYGCETWSLTLMGGKEAEGV